MLRGAADWWLLLLAAAADDEEGEAKGPGCWNSDCVGDRKLNELRSGGGGGGGCAPDGPSAAGPVGPVALLLLLLPEPKKSRRLLSSSSPRRPSTVEWNLDSISLAQAPGALVATGEEGGLTSTNYQTPIGSLVADTCCSVQLQWLIQRGWIDSHR